VLCLSRKQDEEIIIEGSDGPIRIVVVSFGDN